MGVEVKAVTPHAHLYPITGRGSYCKVPGQVKEAAMTSHSFIFASSVNPDLKHLKVPMVLGQTDS